MTKELVTDDLWEIVEPLLPPEPPKPRGCRPRVPDRAALTGIVFVLKTGIPWEMLPKEMGCGSGSTCWRRLRDWQEAGVWERLHRALLDRLGQADEIDWSRACLDSASVPAKRGAEGRQEPDGSRQTGLEAPPCFGPRGRPARRSAHGRQRPRLQGPGGGRGRHRADQAASREARQAEETPRKASRRQGLRLPPLPRGLEEEGHKSAHRPSRYRLQREAGEAQVGGGAHAGLARPLQQAVGALRAARGHP